MHGQWLCDYRLGFFAVLVGGLRMCNLEISFRSFTKPANIDVPRNFRTSYSGRLSREKIFMKFAILQPFMKVFSTKFRHTIQI